MKSFIKFQWVIYLFIYNVIIKYLLRISQCYLGGVIYFIVNLFVIFIFCIEDLLIIVRVNKLEYFVQSLLYEKQFDYKYMRVIGNICFLGQYCYQIQVRRILFQVLSFRRCFFEFCLQGYGNMFVWSLCYIFWVLRILVFFVK